MERLIITIDVMQILQEDALDRVMGWITRLPYPWCGPAEALETMPRIDGLAPIEQYLRQIRPLKPEH